MLINADAFAVSERNLDQAVSFPDRYRRRRFNRWNAFDRRRRRGDLNRHKTRWARSFRRQSNLPPPREHQTRRNSVSARDLRHHSAWDQSLLNDPHLLVARPATSPLNAAQNFNSHKPPLTLPLNPHPSPNPPTTQGTPP